MESKEDVEMVQDVGEPVETTAVGEPTAEEGKTEERGEEQKDLGESREETDKKGDKQEQINLFEKEKEEKPDFIDFEKNEEFKDLKDIFKNSKISEKEYNRYLDKIMESTTAESFSSELSRQYGEQGKQELELFRESTKDLLSKEEKEILNGYPAEVKLMTMKLVNGLAREVKRVEKDYGVTTSLKTKPEMTVDNAKVRFEELTNKMLAGDFRTDREFEALMKERVELAEFINKK